MIIENEREHLPALVFVDLTGHFPFAYLFVKSVEKLLARRCSREGGAMVQGAAKASKIQQTFFRAREWNAHPIKEVDDLRRHVAHSFYRRLVCEKIAAIDGVVQVLCR